MINSISHILSACLSLMFPSLCISCNREIKSERRTLCSSCEDELAYTNFNDNYHPSFHKLSAQTGIESLYILCYYSNKSKIQLLLHALKYKSQPATAYDLGKLFAKRFGEDIDKNAVLIPVPSHISRMAKRGYNQSELIAKSIAQSLDMKMDSQALKRRHFSGSQTGRARSDRHVELANAFELRKKKTLQGLDVILVDDVITTGATITECCRILNKSGIASLRVAAIAITEDI